MTVGQRRDAKNANSNTTLYSIRIPQSTRHLKATIKPQSTCQMKVQLQHTSLLSTNLHQQYTIHFLTINQKPPMTCLKSQIIRKQICTSNNSQVKVLQTENLYSQTLLPTALVYVKDQWMFTNMSCSLGFGISDILYH